MNTFHKGAAIAMLSLVPLGAHAQTPESFVTAEFQASRALELIRAQYAYAAGYTGKGIVIAIVDSGLDIHHPEFAGRVSPYLQNYIPGFSPDDVYSGLDAENQDHGTHVAGLAAAARDGQGMHGVAYNAIVLPLRTDFDDEQLVPAYERAIQAGATVLNGSYGPNVVWKVDPDNSDPSRGQLDFQPVVANAPLEYQMLKGAADADVLMVFAAGNSREEHPGPYTAMPMGAAMLPLITPSNTALGPGQYLYRFLEDLPESGPALFLGDPGSNPDMWAEAQTLDFSSLKGSLIAVVATSPGGEIASYSNWCGAAADWCLAAPGGDYPDLTWSTVPYGKYEGMQGTSMASPVVAGAAAVMREAFPYMSARQVIEIMLTSADNTSNAIWRDKDIYGRGMLDLGTAINGPVVFGDPMFSPVFSVNTQGYDSVWRNHISGTGGLRKAGAGTLTMTGNNIYSGATTIVGGKLVVNGSIEKSSHLLIGSSAVLGGSGVVGVTDMYGRVAPGNSVGTLTVKGDYTQYAGSVFELELGANGDNDVLNVTGKADIQAGSKLEVLGLRASHLGQAFSFLGAGSWGGATFSGAGLDRAFIDLSTSMAGSGLALNVQRNARSFASVGVSPNQRALAAAADSQGVGGAAYNDLVVLRSVNDAPDLYDALAGEIYASTASALLDVGDNLRQTALQRARLGAGAYGDVGANGHKKISAGRGAVWGQAMGSWGQLGGGNQTYALDRSTQGLMFGADTLLADTLKAGVAVGYTNSRFKGRDGDSVKADGYHVLAYGDAQSGHWSLRGGMGYSWYSLNTRRELAYADWGTASSRAHAQSAQVFTELAYGITANQIKIEPYAGLGYTHLRQQGFTETDNPVGLQSGSTSDHVAYTTLGLRAFWDLDANRLGALRATAGLGWRHALGSVDQSRVLRLATGDAYRINGTPLAKNAALAELGIEWSGSARSRVSLNYAGQMAGSTRDHGVQARASWVF